MYRGRSFLSSARSHQAGLAQSSKPKVSVILFLPGSLVLFNSYFCHLRLEEGLANTISMAHSAGNGMRIKVSGLPVHEFHCCGPDTGLQSDTWTWSLLSPHESYLSPHWLERTSMTENCFLLVMFSVPVCLFVIRPGTTLSHLVSDSHKVVWYFNRFSHCWVNRGNLIQLPS